MPWYGWALLGSIVVIVVCSYLLMGGGAALNDREDRARQHWTNQE